jgi:hypothetical protein
LNFGGLLANAKVEYLPGQPNKNVIIFRPSLCSQVSPVDDACWADD